MPATQSLSLGRELVRAVRAGFVTRGTTYSAWCKKNKVNRSNCTQALTGAWDGPKARDLRSRVLRASGVGAIAA